MAQALEDITIVDFTQMMQGPLATQKLADMGAEVIKIEPPWGNMMREGSYREIQGFSALWLSMNRNKRSVALNLKKERGNKIAKDIIKDADILIENFRPGVMERLDLGYEDIREINEKIIYVSATGWGSTGPYSDRPGQDLLAQAVSGMTHLTGQEPNPPTPAGASIADALSAVNLALHTMIALHHRNIAGEGQKIEINLLNSMVDSLCQEVSIELNTNTPLERSERSVYAMQPAPFGIYETADGYIAIAYGPDFETLIEALDISLQTEYESPGAKYENRDKIVNEIESHTLDVPTEELLTILQENDYWVAEVNSMSDMIDDEQIDHNEMIIDVPHPEGGTFKTTGFPAKMTETRGKIELPPPKLGEHTEEILTKIGYDRETIEELSESDIIS